MEQGLLPHRVAAKSPRGAPSPCGAHGHAGCTHRLARARAHTQQQWTSRTGHCSGGQQDLTLPQTPAQTVCGCHIWLLLPEERLPRLLPEPKGRKPAFPGQTGGDIVTSLSCKLLNTTSCQGPLPTAPSPHADTREPGWDHWAGAPAARPRPDAPARSAWCTRETRHPGSLLEAPCLWGTHRTAPRLCCHHIPVQGWEYPVSRGRKMLFPSPRRTRLCPPCPSYLWGH